jgi:hypothetical protein
MVTFVDVKQDAENQGYRELALYVIFGPFRGSRPVREHDTIGHFSSHSRDLAEKWPTLGLNAPSSMFSTSWALFRISSTTLLGTIHHFSSHSRPLLGRSAMVFDDILPARSH